VLGRLGGCTADEVLEDLADLTGCDEIAGATPSADGGALTITVRSPDAAKYLLSLGELDIGGSTITFLDPAPVGARGFGGAAVGMGGSGYPVEYTHLADDRNAERLAIHLHTALKLSAKPTVVPGADVLQCATATDANRLLSQRDGVLFRGISVHFYGEYARLDCMARCWTCSLTAGPVVVVQRPACTWSCGVRSPRRRP
jgi:hypothetical protein